MRTYKEIVKNYILILQKPTKLLDSLDRVAGGG